MGVFIGWRTKFKFFRFFRFFEAMTIKNGYFFSSNDQILTVEFEFKQINQEITPYYRPPTPTTDDSASGSVLESGRTVAPDPTPTRAVPPARPSMSS
jgi:hypothetical protein